MAGIEAGIDVWKPELYAKFVNAYGILVNRTTYRFINDIIRGEDDEGETLRGATRSICAELDTDALTFGLRVAMIILRDVGCILRR